MLKQNSGKTSKADAPSKASAFFRSTDATEADPFESASALLFGFIREALH